MRPGKSPLLYLQPPAGVTEERQRRLLSFVQRANERHLAERNFDDQLAARMNA